MESNDRLILRCENIFKKFKNIVALEDVSFEIQQGEILAIVGENSAGWIEAGLNPLMDPFDSSIIEVSGYVCPRIESYKYKLNLKPCSYSLS